MDETEKPSSQRPEHPDFWCKRFGEGITPWDAGRVPDAFRAFIDAEPTPLNTLIPGCGSAWEAALLAERRWPVTALDFSPTAIAAARAMLGTAAVDLVCDDFFTYTPPQSVQLMYERAFLCALPRKCWPDWGQRVAALLPVGARLVGYFFVCEQLKGPPFGISAEALDALLTPNFVRLVDQPVEDSIPVFAGRERWQVWQRH